MLSKEVNERSPMRVFERSIHGGLGRGKIGVVLSRAGVGKTALLVHIALDNLLRDRRVLHISHEHAVDHVRAYYDELFNDIARRHKLEQQDMVRLDIERRRLIYSHLAKSDEPPVSLRGGSSSISEIQETIGFAREVANFAPEVVIIDGFDFERASLEAVQTLEEMAREIDAEIWLSAKTRERVELASEAPAAPGSTPTPLRRFFDHLGVIVLLQPEGDVVRLRLLKDHDSPDVADLHLRLDPTTMRVIDDDADPRSRGPLDPRSFHLFSGGATGAEAAFGEAAERWGLQETNFSFEGHTACARKRGVVQLSEMDLKKGDFSIVYASHRLSRPLSEIPNVQRIMQTIWHQISSANEVFVVGEIEPAGTVRGGTGWGAELARIWRKRLVVFDQGRGGWHRWTGTSWERSSEPPLITSDAFAGIGTMKLSPEGRAAIDDLFERSFGRG